MPRNISNDFPNPVLCKGGDDYIEGCSFDSEVNEDAVTVDGDHIVVPVSYSLSCPVLESLVSGGDAVVAFSAKSPASSYSALFQLESESPTTNIRIPKFAVMQRIDIEAIVLAAKNLDEYDGGQQLNRDYFDGVSFSLDKGAILAFDDVKRIYIDDTELEKPLTSIFEMVPDANQAEPMCPYFHDERIQVHLNSELWELYNMLAGSNHSSLARFVNGITTFPVLVEAVNRVAHFDKEGTQGEDDRRWFRAIQHKAEQLQVDVDGSEDSITMLADKLYGEISLDALKQFKEAYETEINSGDMQYLGGRD